MNTFRRRATLLTLTLLPILAAETARAQTAAPAPFGVGLPAATVDRPLRTSPAPAFQGPLTLPQVEALATELNPAIAQTNAALLTAQGGTYVQRAAYGATFGADAGVNVYGDGINAYNGRRLTDADQHVEPAVGALATLPIDITGYLHAAVDQANFQEVAARLEVNRARNIVVAGAGTAFYVVLRAQSIVNVARENLADSEARLADAQAKFQSQTVAILDVVRAQTDVATAQQQLISARSAVAIDLSNLNEAIGLDVNSPIQVSDAGAVEQPPGIAPPAVPAVTPDTALGPAGTMGGESSLQSDMAPAAAVAARVNASLANTPPGSGQTTDSAADAASEPAAVPGLDLPALIAEAVAKRPEVLQTNADIAAAQKGIFFARRSTLPQMSVGLRYEYAAQTFGTSVELNNPQAFVGFTLPIIDAGLARARVKEAVGRKADAQVAQRQTIDSVTLDVRTAYLNLADARARVGVANQSLAQAREAFLLARIRYNAGVTAKAGLSPLLEVSDAQAALVLAETNQVNAVYDYNTARIRLDYAVGRYSY